MSIEEEENLYHGILYSEDAELYYAVVFPDFADTVMKNEVTNPVFPDTKITPKYLLFIKLLFFVTK